MYAISRSRVAERLFPMAKRGKYGWFGPAMMIGLTILGLVLAGSFVLQSASDRIIASYPHDKESRVTAAPADSFHHKAPVKHSLHPLRILLWRPADLMDKFAPRPRHDDRVSVIKMFRTTEPIS
jgi:hypothetical protein